MVALVARLLLDATLASWVGACLAGSCELGEKLARIAVRESQGRLVGLHEMDAWAGPIAWRNAVLRGRLEARCQPRGDGRRWSTRGVHGQLAAYAVPHLWECAGPGWIDIPAVSAYAAARRIQSRQCAATKRCRSWKGAA